MVNEDNFSIIYSAPHNKMVSIDKMVNEDNFS